MLLMQGNITFVVPPSESLVLCYKKRRKYHPHPKYMVFGKSWNKIPSNSSNFLNNERLRNIMLIFNLINSVYLKCFLFLPGAGLHNGQWHSVFLSAKRNRVSLIIDNDAASSSHASVPIQIFSGDSYYFGG